MLTVTEVHVHFFYSTNESFLSNFPKVIQLFLKPALEQSLPF